MDPIPSAQDLEARAATISDPGVELKVRINAAMELCEMVDAVKDVDATRVIPHIIPNLLELLQSGEIPYRKDSMDYRFRRLVLETFGRVVCNDAARQQTSLIVRGLFHIITHDSEENAVTSARILHEVTRLGRVFNEPLFPELVDLTRTVLSNMPKLVEEFLSGDSERIDPITVLPADRSFKVVTEVIMAVITWFRIARGSAQTRSPNLISVPNPSEFIQMGLEVLPLQSSAQRKTREDYEAMGTIWTGTSPDIVNTQAYADFISAEVKIMNMIVFLVHPLQEKTEDIAALLATSCVRLLQDCTTHAIAPRKDLIVALRTINAGPYRVHLLKDMDKLLDEKVLLGTGVGVNETLRGYSHSAMADLIHHVRNDISAKQLRSICLFYAKLMLDPFVSINVHAICAKVIYTALDAVIAKDTPEGAAGVIMAVFETSVERATALALVLDDIIHRMDVSKKGSVEEQDAFLIERQRPVPTASYVIDRPEEGFRECQVLFRTLLHVFRACLSSLKKCAGRPPDGPVVTRMFDACLSGLRLVPDTGHVDQELLCQVLSELDVHVYGNLWAARIDAYFKASLEQASISSLYAILTTRELMLPVTMAVVLRFLVNKLSQLGDEDDVTAAMTVRFYKLTFNPLGGSFASSAEHALKNHIGQLIMDSFPFAAKASNPMNYYHLLRVLFRAIASGGGRFERLYGEVLPLLPEMLESLNRHLLAAEGPARQMLIELCLTVPLRLTHLLPHLNYLMRPLVMALRSGPDLVSQGLRTLELCVDNLMADFLDPTLKPVLRDLMEALHSHLKPLPANHLQAHTTVRILGKLGGRNRRLLYSDSQFKFSDASEGSSLAISLVGSIRRISLDAMVPVAFRAVQQPKSALGPDAYQFLESCVLLLVAQGMLSRNQLDSFVMSLEGVFHAIHNPELASKAVPFIQDISRYILAGEIRMSLGKDSASRRYTPGPLMSAYLDAMVHAIDRVDESESRRSLDLVIAVVKGLIGMDHEVGVQKHDIIPTLNHVVTRLSALCLEDSWNSKVAACNGIKALIKLSSSGVRWVYEREIDLVRTILHVLKDLPSDPPKNVDDVIDIVKLVLQVSNEEIDYYDEPLIQRQGKHSHLIGILFMEVASSNLFVRNAAQTCIALVANLTGRPIAELLLPHRDRMLANLFSKPLRALPYSLQIGMIDAFRYCVGMEPPLADLNDELLRLLHEALAIADAEEPAPQPRARQVLLDNMKLRVACIKLLTASMPLTDFFSRHTATRQKLTGVYFKSLYSTSQEIKEVAHEGLKMVLTHQSRLPRELLQQGLRPILMNLADPKRLSISGLEGLGRLLELLTSYFKVEIGHKLLDHFRTVAEPQSLSLDPRLPWAENDSITKLARLANIFHLLPPAANMFLEKFVDVIVHTESQMQFWDINAFSEPLAKFLDRYPADSVELLLRNIQSPRHVCTFRSVLRARLVPNLRLELATCTQKWLRCLYSDDNNVVLHGLQLVEDLTELQHNWIEGREDIVQAVLHNWRSFHLLDVTTPTTPLSASKTARQMEVMVTVLLNAVEHSSRIDLLFELVAIYTRDVALDLTRVTQMIYRHVAGNSSLAYRRNILMRFVVLFGAGSLAANVCSHVLRFLITPILIVHSKAGKPQHLLSLELIACFHRLFWHPLSEDPGHGDFDGRLILEILHMTTILVQHYSSLLHEAQKDVFRCTWHFIKNDDSVVKQTALLLAARFLEVFPAPEKFVLGAWTGLLRPPQAEGKGPLRQALDILAPVLRQTEKEGESGYTQWARTTRRLLAEEGNGMAQIITIYQLIVRHPKLFYPCRGLFVPHMVNSLSKLATPGTGGVDSRSLSIDILQVMFQWEITSSEEVQSTGWVTPLAFRETMVSYLMKFAMSPDSSNARTPQKALTLLRSMMSHGRWKEVTLKLHFFSRALEVNEVSNETEPAARVLRAVVNDKDDQWIVDNAKSLERLVRKGMRSDHANLHDALHPVFNRLVRLFPLPKEEEGSGPLHDFHSFVYSAIHEGLRSNDKLNQQNPALRGPILMLKSVIDVTPERIEPFALGLTKICARLAKEHAQTPPTGQYFEAGARVVKAMLEIFHDTISFLGDQRKTVWQCLSMLADRSQSPFLCRYLLDIARDLVLNRRDTYPNIKDKVMFLQKMAAFEKQGDPLFNGYLELIFDIYTDPSLRRSELTARLEHSFLVGCRARDPVLRGKFIDLLDDNLPRSPFGRLSYLLGVQSWEALADYNWIYLALHLLMGSVDGEVSMLGSHLSSNPPFASRMKHAGHILKPMQQLLYADRQATHDTWVSVFSAVWTCLTRREHVEITQYLISLLSRDSHSKQMHLRPNVIQTLLAGVLACTPPLILPPHLVKYLAKTYGAWYVGLELIQRCLEDVREEDSTVQGSVKDSLAEIYAELAEDDMFYGLWRRRGLCDETNVGIAFEQNGMWDLAASVYESGLNKSRTAPSSFVEQEFCLWEDHWILAQEKLQQWDTLHELARGESNQELMLEAAWRTKDWAEQRDVMEEQLASVSEIVATPRRRVFEAFLAAMKVSSSGNANDEEFKKILEEAMQLSLQKWIALPPQLSYAHIPLLQHFQQFVELHEAGQIFTSLAATTAQNLEKKSADLKMVLQAWRERLPGPCDDISVWSDLVAWRQNVFNCINKAYVPLVPNTPSNQNPANAANNQNTSGFRGYHETAWIVNRFAQIARRHGLLEVCFTSLAKIYTLPNIEISEAFLKLREQARCYYQKGSELTAGLDVINNTNLMYFTNPQKAEFYTLKGMFHAALGRSEDASEAFSQAVQMDMNQAKAWAEWGKYSDQLFKDHPEDMSHAANAVSCYLQAAGLFRSGKSRAMLTRVLWLLSIDDQSLTVSRAFDTYKGEASFWYWISLIPQLCLSISHREVKQARYILLNIAKLYPQALFFHLRTTREDFALVKRQAFMAAAAANARRAQPASVPDSSIPHERESASATLTNGAIPIQMNTAGLAYGDAAQFAQRQSWDYVEEIVQILKTAFPLLILTMETMVDQINQKFKSSAEEEIYRLVSMLLQEAMMNYIQRIKELADDGQLSEGSISNVAKMLPNISPTYRAEFEETFIKPKPSLLEYIRGLQHWRDRHERKLDTRPRMQSLDLLSHYLVEFQYSKFDDIEVPGQYTEDKDNNIGFVRIQKFGPQFENCRSHGYSWKRFTVHGSDGSTMSFSVQLPSGRHTRKEEKVMQVFRSFNEILKHKKESRRRNLAFHLPSSITCSSGLRLLQNDSSYINLGDIYDQYCESIHARREDPILHVGDKARAVLRDYQLTYDRVPDRLEFLEMKAKATSEVAIKIIPEDVLTRYMIRTMHGPDELWRMRKQFALQLSAASFLTYVMTLHSRVPARFHWSRQTGKIYMSELLPAQATANEEVPFRLTPNLQHFLGNICREGVFVSGMFAIARCLTENTFDMNQQMCLFARDEVLTFIHSKGKPWTFDLTFRQHVAQYVENVTKKAEIMACKAEREALEKHGGPTGTQPIIQTLLNLVSTATNPHALARMGEHFLPWF